MLALVRDGRGPLPRPIGGTNMASRPPLRPRLFAEGVMQAIASAAAEGRVLDIAIEARRIARASGMPARLAAAELLEIGVKARLPLELPRSRDLVDDRYH